MKPRRAGSGQLIEGTEYVVWSKWGYGHSCDTLEEAIATKERLERHGGEGGTGGVDVPPWHIERRTITKERLEPPYMTHADLEDTT